MAEEKLEYFVGKYGDLGWENSIHTRYLSQFVGRYGGKKEDLFYVYEKGHSIYEERTIILFHLNGKDIVLSTGVGCTMFELEKRLTDFSQEELKEKAKSIPPSKLLGILQRYIAKVESKI